MLTARTADVCSDFEKHCEHDREGDETLTITREDGDDVVLLPEREWKSMQETFFFIGNLEER